jgi:hypothetical protein
MPTRDGYNIPQVIFDDVPARPTRIDWDSISWYPTQMTAWGNYECKCKVNYSEAELLGKCGKCVSCYTRADGVKVCLYSKNGRPNDETCNYERKKR